LGGKSLVSCVFGSRFDVAGAAGACLKRYTDPSFFKMEWAKSELMKSPAHTTLQESQYRKGKEYICSSEFPFIPDIYSLDQDIY
jgi:hypothetical protein